MQNIGVKLLNDLAIGTIGPGTRIAKGDIEESIVDDLTERLETDEFYDSICEELGPNSAGGTFSLVIADALTDSRFRINNQTSDQHARILYKWLLDNKNTDEYREVIPRVCVDGRLPVVDSKKILSVIGTHDGLHGSEGCGSQNRLEDILIYIRDRSADLKQAAGYLGVRIDEPTNQLIINNAKELLMSGYVSSGEELRRASVEVAGEDSVTELIGVHSEVVACINTDVSKTLNRAKINTLFGDKYHAFNVDVGVFKDASAVISDGSIEDINQKFVAMLYYNLATTFVLSDKSLRLALHGSV